MVKPAESPLSISEHNAGACERAYAARYLSEQWPREPKIGTNTGSKLHELADAYVKHGQRPMRVDPISELFIEGLPYLPKPGSAVHVERKQLIEVGGLPFEFTPDIAAHDGSFVWDHKTTKNLRYALKEKYDRENEYGEITPGKASDAQTLVYLYALGHPHPTFSHVYYVKTRAILELERQDCVVYARTAPDQITYDRARETYEKLTRQIEKQRVSPQAKAFACSFTRAELHTQLDKIVLPRSEKLLTLRQKWSGRNPDPLSFTPNLKQCDKYGGCPHLARCKPSFTTNHIVADLDLTTDKETDDMAFTFTQQLPPVNGPQFAPPQAAPVQQQFAAPAPQAPQTQVGQAAPAQAQFSFPAPQPVQYAQPTPPAAQAQFSFPAPQPVQYAQPTPPAAPQAPVNFTNNPSAPEQYTQRIEQSPHFSAPANGALTRDMVLGAPVQAAVAGASDAELGAALRALLRAAGLVK